MRSIQFAALGLITAMSTGVTGPALADCAAEIDALSKTLAASDAGSGPTTGTSGAAGSGASAGTPEPGTAPGTEATSAMNQVTEGQATSSGDVQRQTEGQPTAGDAAQSGEATSTGGAEAQSALAKARRAHQAGDEAGCMEAIGQAKSAMPG